MSPVTQPRQRRSRLTMTRLLDAAEAALNEKDFDSLGIQEISSRAGCSVGAFYARFSNKEALRECLLDRYAEDLGDLVKDFARDSRWEGKALPERAEAFIARVIRGCRRRRGLMRMRYLHLVTRGDAGSRPTPGELRFVGGIEEFFRPCLGEIDHPEPERAISFGLRLIDTMAAHVVLLDQEIGVSYRSIDDRALIAELTRAFLGYLGYRTPGKEKR